MKEMFEDIQQKFLLQIKSKVPVNYSFAEVLSDDLGISTDSAYRRIRGETELSFDELRKLCVKYGVSLDAIISASQNTVLFNYRAVDPNNFSFDNYLNSIAENLATMNSFKVKELTYAAKDIPLFYYYIFPRLSAFKIFFWLKNIFKFPDFKEKKFALDEIPQSTLVFGRKIWKQYITIPSVEIWSDECINVTLKQIEFYRDCGVFQNEDELIYLLDDVLKLIKHVQMQAEKGYKFDIDDDRELGQNEYKLYYNEILIMDNTVFFIMDDLKVTHLGNNVINILTTTDPQFCDHTEKTVQNVIKNSTLISVAAEKVRNQFFNSMRNKVERILNKNKEVF